jgi:hypothetical protein
MLKATTTAAFFQKNYAVDPCRGGRLQRDYIVRGNTHNNSIGFNIS